MPKVNSDLIASLEAELLDGRDPDREAEKARAFAAGDRQRDRITFMFALGIYLAMMGVALGVPLVGRLV